MYTLKELPKTQRLEAPIVASGREDPSFLDFGFIDTPIIGGQRKTFRYWIGNGDSFDVSGGDAALDGAIEYITMIKRELGRDALLGPALDLSEWDGTPSTFKRMPLRLYDPRERLGTYAVMNNDTQPRLGFSILFDGLGPVEKHRDDLLFQQTLLLAKQRYLR